jgi:transcription initiation factor IIF auxiliary subunit
MKLQLLRTLAIIIVCVSFASPQSAQELTVSNTSSYIGKSRWAWTLYVEGPASVVGKIKCVQYTLHPTFPNPVRVVCQRGLNDKEPFALHGDGWGEFDVGVKVMFANGEKNLSLPPYRLKLSER